MTDASLYALARRADILVDWIDAADRPQHVTPEALRLVLTALGFPCGTAADVAQSIDELIAAETILLPEMITADAGEPVLVPYSRETRGRLMLEDGTQHDARLEPKAAGTELPPVSEPGYHTLHLGDRAIRIAVAPRRCFTLADVAPNEKLWGLAVQFYGLRRAGDGGIGDTTALSVLANSAASQGADAIAISPTHALFGARPDKFSPYSPSNRLFLNPLLADPAVIFGAEAAASAKEEAALIDWPAAAARKFALLRQLFGRFWQRLNEAGGDPSARDFRDFRQSGGAALESHACFEAIHADMVSRGLSSGGWRDWPAELATPDAPTVRTFAAAHEREIAFHIFLQWLADRAFGKVQAEARAAPMRVGLIADLAVGMESGGSYAWAHQQDVLPRLTIGAPPDLFNPNGQNWGLTTFSPHAFASNGFEPFLATIRATLRHAGGVRIDHILGLKRLWVVPEGTPSRAGAYLSYPLDDLLRLIRLESFRHRAIIIGEDLGTVPLGFRGKLADAGIAGMDVLWFSRTKDGFSDPRRWRRDALATTSTHDLPTVAGWWRGADIAFRAGQGLPEDSADAEKAARESERKDLWHAFTSAGAAPDTPPRDLTAVVDAAVTFTAKSPASLVLLPLEDALGLEEQPNVPGTIDEHPNWRRRYPVAAQDVFSDPAVLSRVKILDRRGEP